MGPKSDFLDDNRIHMDWSVIKWSLVAAFRMDARTSVLWTLMSTLSGLLPAMFLSITKEIVDHIQENVQAGMGVSSIGIFLAAMVVILFVQSLFERIPNVMWCSLRDKYAICLQKKMAEFMRRVPVRYLDDAKTAKMIEMAEWNAEGGSLGKFVCSFIDCCSSILKFLSLLFVSWHTSLWLVPIAFVFLAAMLPYSLKAAKGDWKSWTDVAKNERRMDYHYARIFNEEDAKEVRLLNMKDFIFKKWNEDAVIVRDNSLARDKKVSMVNHLMDTAITVAKCLVLFLGIFLLQRGKLTLGGLTVFVSVFEELSWAARAFANIFLNFYRQSCELKYSKNLFDMTFEARDRTFVRENDSPSADKAGKQPLIFEAKHVSFEYQDDKEVLHDLSLQVRQGETVALVGENGAGKSTLIKLLLGLYEPKSGELYFRGKNYRDINTEKLLESIGVTFQDFVRFELMVRENVAFGDISRVHDDQEIRQALERGGALHVVSRLPQDMDTYIGRWYEKDGVRMSGGEWQRLAVSRSYISNKEILIMDEPAAALDPIAEMEQFYGIKNSLTECTSILISHRIGFARLADKIVVLQEGRLVETGSHEELMEKQGIYYQMFMNQAGWYDKEAG